MSKERIVVECRISGGVFTEYALFDVLRRQRRWVRPLLFALAFVAFSLIAFSQRAKNPQAVLLGGVLLGVGLVLPAVYFLSFFLSVRRRAKAQKGAGAAYTLCLDADGLEVTKGPQKLRYAWEELAEAHRLKNCICLYVDKSHAFLLPQDCGERPYQAAWALISTHTDPARLRDHRAANRFT